MSRKKNKRSIKKQLKTEPANKAYLLSVFLAATLVGFFSVYTFPWSGNAWPVAILIGAFAGLWAENFLELSLTSFFSAVLVFSLISNTQAFQPFFQLDMDLSYLVPTCSFSFWLLMGLLSMLASLATTQIVTATKKRGSLIFILLSLIILNYLLVGLSYNQTLNDISQEPPDEQYRFDPIIFLKAFYLMERGLPYYKAYGEAYKKDSAHDSYPEYTQTYRFPTVFYLWKALCPPDGKWLNFLFTFFALLTLLCSFLIAWKFTPTPWALLAPILLVPYLLYGNLTMWFLATEYWAMFLVVIAVFLYVYNYPWASIVTAFFSALTRELGAFLLLAGLIASWLSGKKKESVIWALALLILVTAYLFHLNAAKPFTSGKPTQSFFAWQLFRLDAFKAITEFGFATVPYNKIWAFPLLLLSLIGIYLMPAKETRSFLIGVTLLPALIFLALGRDPGAGYWGVVWMPLVLTTAPFFFASIEKKLKQLGG